jgi:hypothetical protein
MGDGHQVTRIHLRRVGSGCSRTGSGGAQDRRPFGLRGMEQADARLSGTGAAIARAGDAINAGFGYLEVKCLGWPDWDRGVWACVPLGVGT